MSSSRDVDIISELAATLPRFLGEHPAESLLGIILTGTLIEFVVRASITEVLDDPSLSIRFAKQIGQAPTGDGIVLLAITGNSRLGIEAIERVRLLTLAQNVIDTAVVRTSEYSRNGGRGPRLPLVQVGTLEPTQQGDITRINGLDLVSR